MNLKQRFSFIFSSLFSVVLATVMLIVYYLFADMRREELIAELTEKAQTTVKLLIETQEVHYDMHKIIDKNSVNNLHFEKIQIYNETKKLLYSSTVAPTIKLTYADLDLLKKKRLVLRNVNPNVVLGFYYKSGNDGYYVLISADDNYDKNKLNHLKYVLFVLFVTGLIVVWILSFSLSKKALEPLDNFRRKIQEITDSNLKIRLSKEEREDEINTLAGSFNQMMDRIDNAYDRQKEFTGNASHELRTPVARIAAQLENLLNRTNIDPSIKLSLTSIFNDTFQLSEVISSLVALADINSREHNFSFVKLRLDEIIFSTTTELSKIYHDFKLKFEIENNTVNETDLEIMGDETLLKIALSNLFKNAYVYSDNHTVECLIRQNNGEIELLLTNTGKTPEIEDPRTLFTTFYRGNNSHQVSGSGIGLSIVKRVLDYHNATIIYNILDSNTNQIVTRFLV
ncbi:two-component system sensor histidine kinase ArlS [Pedobacter sp. UYP24]